MRVAVVVSPFYLADELSRLLPTLAAGCIQADLRRYGHSVEIHDLRPLIATRGTWHEYLSSSRAWVMEAPHLRLMDRLRHKFQSGASPEALLHLDDDDRASIVDLSMDLCTSPIGNLAAFEAVHELMDRAARRLTGADVVALSAAIHTNLYANLLLGFLLKRYHPGMPVIIGGPSVYQGQHLARYLAATGAFDAVALGDAETILPPYLAALEAGRAPSSVPGIIVGGPRGADGPRQAPPPTVMADLPTPDFTGLDLSAYLPLALPIHTSRGCIYRCRYCSEHRERYDWMPVEQVVRDIRTLQARHRTRLFFFCDSLLNGDRDRFYDLCDALAPLDIRWVAYLRAGGKPSLTPANARRMAESGCYLIRLGLDALDPAILKGMSRVQNPAATLQEIGVLQAAGVQVDANLITGYPGETRAMVLNAIWQLQPLTQAAQRRFAATGDSFFEELVASDYARAPLDRLTSLMVYVHPYHVRPGSRTYACPEQDGLTLHHFDPDQFSYGIDPDMAALIRQIPDSFSGDVPASEILHRVRLIDRSLDQPTAAISAIREMALMLWAHARALQPDDRVGPLTKLPLYRDSTGAGFLYVRALRRHLPLRGGLAVVVDELVRRSSCTVGELLAAGESAAVRYALALLIVTGLLPPPIPAQPPGVGAQVGSTDRSR